MYGQSQEKREWPYSMLVFYTLVEDLSEDAAEIYRHWGELKDITMKDLSEYLQSQIKFMDAQAQQAMDELDDAMADLDARMSLAN